MYCNWLSQKEGRKPCYERTGTKEKNPFNNKEENDSWRFIEGSKGYRLPREAEWEYVCRAGTQTEYSMGNDETLLASYCQMSPSKQTSPCGVKIPNGWGLHDVHGNVWEWCEVWTDSSGSFRVYRGGGWGNGAVGCRPAIRDGGDPSFRANSIGFRVALSPSVKQPEAKHNE